MKGYFSFSIHKNRIKFILLDFLWLFISVVTAYLIRVKFHIALLANISIAKIVFYYLLLLVQMALIFYITGVYDRRELDNFSRHFTRLVSSVLLMGLISGLFFYFQQAFYVGRLVFVTQLLIFFTLSLLGKYVLILHLNKKETQPQLILVNLSTEEKELLQNEPDIHMDFHFSYFEFSQKEELETFIQNLDRNTLVVVSTASEVVDHYLPHFIRMKFSNYHVYDLKTFYINITGKIPRSSFSEIWSIMSESEFVMGIKSYYRLKRVADICFSLLGFVLTLPFFLVLPLLIKLTSRGPVFFVQERLGWNKRPFNLIKFRTMKANAEQENGPQWALADDPRITGLGRLLRKTRLDELPQLFNVLKGEMSVVGIRPIRKHFADLLAQEIPYYDVRFFIKPGLTGWSQVKYDYAGSMEGQAEKFKYELFYIKNMSFVLDIIILLKTIKTVFGLHENLDGIN